MSLLLWTIYERPLDYPDGFVVRLHRVLPGMSVATNHAVVAESLEEARGLIPGRCSMLRVPRSPQDEPQIVESWL